MNQTMTSEDYQAGMREAVTTLLDVNAEQDVLRQTLITINRLFTDVSHVRGEESDEAKQNNLMLPSGIAISPEFAAMNLRDVLRTAKYMRAIKNAVDKTLERLSGDRVHLVYAGCGPYGTLVLPLLALYKPQQLKVTLLEIQPKSLRSITDICNAMGFGDYIGSIVQTDATAYKHPEDDPIHIVAMECMRHALDREPQVRISMNLAAQLVEDGILIPEEVNVSFYAVDPEIEFNIDGKGDGKEKVRQHLGDVFVLDKYCYTLPVEQDSEDEAPYIRASTIKLPDNLLPLLPLMLFTEIRLYDDTMLSWYESGITYPLVVGQQDSFNPGDEMTFKYRLNNEPVFYYDKTAVNEWA